MSQLELKQCGVCKGHKAHAEFYLRNGKLTRACKACSRESRRISYVKTGGHKNKVKNNKDLPTVEYKKRYPEKEIARVRAKNVRKVPGYERHHWSYLEEHREDVLHINEKYHSLAHKYLKYDAKSMKYRTLTGRLLNTKDRHMAYVKNTLRIYESITGKVFEEGANENRKSRVHRGRNPKLL